MKAALLLFTYKRSYHTEQVIKALKQNTVLPSKLFVFQDGKKNEKDSVEWEKVNKLIHEIDWCDKEIIVSERNKGLASSIVAGINYVFQEYEAVIVLEDDCVPTKNFICFMQQCFDKYQNNQNVYCINGYSFPVRLEKSQYDVYGCGRIGSWGWGTWKEKWNIFHKDYELVRKMKQEERLSRNLAMWGGSLEDMLVGNIRGTHDSWAVFWALNVIAKEGICVTPYESFIKNIGMDGSGEHCGSTQHYDVKCIDRGKESFQLPDEISISNETIKAYVPLCGSYTALKQEGAHKEKILVYGLGDFYLKNEKEINEKYHIEAFIDRQKHGWFAGKKIISIDEITQYSYDKILIMVMGIGECRNIVNKLMSRGLRSEQILLGNNFYGKWSIIYAAK